MMPIEIQQLKSAGINYEDVYNRMMGNEELVERFMLKFLEDTTIQKVIEDFEHQDMVELEKSSHTLKGISGNLGMKALFETSAQMVNHIRLAQFTSLSQDYADLMQVYEKTVEGIKDVFVKS